MSSIKDLKEDVDVKLDKLDARADAFQAALAGSKPQIDEGIQGNKQAVRRALDKLATDIEQQKDLPVKRKESMRSLVDNLNEQIASSQAAAHEILASARRQMHEVTQKSKPRWIPLLPSPKARTRNCCTHPSAPTRERCTSSTLR